MITCEKRSPTDVNVNHSERLKTSMCVSEGSACEAGTTCVSDCVCVCPEGLRSVEVDVIYLDSEDDLTSNLTLLRERNEGKTQTLVVCCEYLL